MVFDNAFSLDKYLSISLTYNWYMQHAVKVPVSHQTYRFYHPSEFQDFKTAPQAFPYYSRVATFKLFSFFPYSFIRNLQNNSFIFIFFTTSMIITIFKKKDWFSVSYALITSAFLYTKNTVKSEDSSIIEDKNWHIQK